jgi:hypothetical protein
MDDPTNPGQAPVPASGHPAERRFGDEQVRRILRDAAELQERSSVQPLDSARGLTLEELRQIAAEVGIDPGFVDLAASHADAPVERSGSRAVGAPTRWHFRTTVPGEIEQGDLDRILQVIRATLQQKGEVSEVWGRIEWSHEEVGSTIVGISQRDGATEFDVSSVKSEEATVIHLMGVVFGGILGGAGLGAALGLSGPAVLPLIAAMGGVSYVGARLGWKARSAWWERRLRTLTERLAGVAHEVARLPAPEVGGLEGSAARGDAEAGSPGTAAG